MGDRVRIGTCANPAEAALLRSLFAAHDIPIAIGGEQHASMMGGLGSFISMDIWVDSDDAERAKELLPHVEPDPDAPDENDDDDDGGDDISHRLERRKRIGVALALAFMISFGTAHLSTGAYKRAIAIAAIEIYGLSLLRLGPWPGAVLVAGAILFDAIGAVTILRKRFARGIPTARVRK